MGVIRREVKCLMGYQTDEKVGSQNANIPLFMSNIQSKARKI